MREFVFLPFSSLSFSPFSLLSLPLSSTFCELKIPKNCRRRRPPELDAMPFCKTLQRYLSTTSAGQNLSFFLSKSKFCDSTHIDELILKIYEQLAWYPSMWVFLINLKNTIKYYCAHSSTDSFNQIPATLCLHHCHTQPTSPNTLHHYGAEVYPFLYPL